ncbi:Protein of unknown function DUF2605 [Leptolyngbya sp. BL0902]|uniref:DUF2605 domain-containing protein n=1 Tax=Leptolyngbya sp. BL0902 TaxID=1115757 RepID=UPI0018E8E0A0|nr:DUF2605 domain-containing protein [Leptolyngbya sp. BL0902]QQE66458.1 Protein of unknown function DUF2605 [Leptolyngbya sp. BL0902]
MPPDHPDNEADTQATLLAQVLSPLLDDFQYWFQRSLTLLEAGPLQGTSAEDQAKLLTRVQQAMAETQTAASLLAVTDGQVGVDPAQVMHWHALVAECWVVARRHRSLSS